MLSEFRRKQCPKPPSLSESRLSLELVSLCLLHQGQLLAHGGVEVEVVVVVARLDRRLLRPFLWLHDRLRGLCLLVAIQID